MSVQPSAVLRQIARNELTRRAKDSSDSAAVLSAGAGAWDDFAAVMVPLIGRNGVDGLTTRAAHLARRDLSLPIPQGADVLRTDSDHEISWLRRVDESEVAAATEVMLATLASLMITFIGESLTMRLLRKAWPGGFSAGVSEGSQT